MIDKKHICKYCNKEFNSGQSLGAHIICCKHNPNNHIQEFAEKRREKLRQKNPILEVELTCPICQKKYIITVSEHLFNIGKYKHTCSKKCANILSLKHTDINKKNQKITESAKKYYSDKLKIITGICKFCGKEFQQVRTKKGSITKRKFCSKECRSKFRSQYAKNTHLGGIKINAYKKYKSGWYHDIHCDSSWELAFVIYCNDHNIQIKRNKIPLQYVYKEKIYKYYPDFIINDQLYEIKGYENEKATAKREQHPEVIYLDKYKMKKYISYVVEKYGKDFVKMYDKTDKLPN